MRVGSTLYYVLKEHLGSASVVTDASGVVVGENRYFPFGETRVATGTILTDKLFTGQREMRRPEPVEGAGLGIYHFNARFYSPKLGRFLSADTIVPGYANPQNLNRMSYVTNNPLRYTDPTGHRPCGEAFGCSSGPRSPIIRTMMDEGGGGGGGSCGGPGQQSCGGVSGNSGNGGGNDDDTPPTLPDPSLTAPPVNGNPCPDSYTYVQCYYSGYMLVLNGDVAIDQDQFNLLLIAIYFDLKNRAPVGGYDYEARSLYDTPFWNGNGNLPGNLCHNNQCYERSKVNYIAQGMWVGASGQSLIEGDVGVHAWNISKYRHLADTDELYWFEFCYNNFNALDPCIRNL